MRHEIRDRPWEKVGTNLYTLDGQEYLIVVDYFSNFWEIDHLHDTKVSTVIKKLKCHFARHGMPDIVMSDNGPQFACEKFSRRMRFRAPSGDSGAPTDKRQGKSSCERGKTPSAKSQRNQGRPISCRISTTEHSH